MRLTLVKEIGPNGDIRYWSELNGEKVTPCTINYFRAKMHFDTFPLSTEENITTIIEERDI